MIINLTQHAASPEQIAAGVVDFDGEEKRALIEALTFEELPSSNDIEAAALAISTLADCWADREGIAAPSAMIGGAPFLMAPLERALSQDFVVLYAFSTRESVDVVQPDGSTKKTSVFRHVGFVEAC